jgi:hypothetical protein
MTAYAYPDEPHVRRHGPRGYASPASFRPWLRDEFAFRCVYCLVREQWGRTNGLFDVDHFVPVAIKAEGMLEYDNLLYSCRACNAAKWLQTIPDPCVALIASALQVQEDGRLVATTRDATRIIRVLGLNDPEQIEMRLLWLGVIALAKQHDPALYARLMGFPTDLPDLRRLRPPEGNTRPAGVAASYYALAEAGKLAPSY